MNQKKTGVVLSYINIVATIAVSLLYTPIMLRIVGPNEYGVYSISNSVVGYFSLLYLGMTSTYLNYYSNYKKNRNLLAISRLNGLFLILFSFMGMTVLALGIVSSYHLELILGDGITTEEYQLAHVLFVIMSVNMAILMPKTVFATIAFSRERFVFIKGLGIINTLLTPILALPFLYAGGGTIAMSGIALGITVLDLLVNVWYCLFRMKCSFSFDKIPFYLIPGMLSFSIFIIIQGIMDQFNWQLGKLLLSHFVDSKAIAVYSVGLQFSMLFISFAAAFSGVVVPQIYDLVSKGERTALDALWIKIGRYQFYITFFIFLGFVLWGKIFIRLWAGSDYDEAYIVAILLMTPLVIHLCQMIGIEILRAYNKHARWVMIHLLFAVLGFLICIPLTKEYGVLGVSSGCCVTMFIVANVYDNWYYYKEAHLNVKAFFKELSRLMPAAFIVALCGWIISRCFTVISWGDFLLNVSIFATVYAVIMYFVGMNDDEKKQVWGLCKKMMSFEN